MSFEMQTEFIPGDMIQGNHMESFGLMPVHTDCTVCRKGISEGRIVEGTMIGTVHKNEGCVVIKFYGVCCLANVAVKTGNKCQALYLTRKARGSQSSYF